MTVVEHFCEVGGGVRLCYRTSGDPGGEPILLVAGLGQQLHSWPPELCDALAAQGHLVVRFDNRDTGRSWRSPHPAPRPQQLLLRRFAPAQYTLADMAGDTAGLIDALGLHSAHLVGASMGAMIAQSTAARHPGRVRSLVSIMSTTGARGVGGTALSTLRRMMAPPPAERERWVARTVDLLRHIGSHGFPFDEDRARAVSIEAWERGGGAAGRAGTMRQLAAIMKSGDRTAELREIGAPTLVIHGDRDRMVAPSGAVATAKAIPDARLHTIAGMGHDLPAGTLPTIAELVGAHVRGAGARSSSSSEPALAQPTRAARAAR